MGKFEFVGSFEEQEGAQYFDSEDLYQQLNYECNDFGDDSGSDRDEDVVWLSDSALISLTLFPDDSDSGTMQESGFFYLEIPENFISTADIYTDVR